MSINGNKSKVTNFENIPLHNNVNTISSSRFPQSFPIHWHQYIEIIALPEDAVVTHPPIININQTSYKLNPGDILFIWSGELHETVDNFEKKLIGVQFSRTLLTDLPDFAAYLHLFRTYHLISRTEIPELSENLFMYINQILTVNLMRNKANKNPFELSQTCFCGVENTIHLYELFIEFGSYLNTIQPDKSSFLSIGNETLNKLNLTCNYITENCNQPLSLNTAADYAGFSSCYFSRIFSQVTGYNFIEYLTIQRVKLAQRMLGDSSLAITEISYQSGFKSISTFNRVFRLYSGCSPSEYRQYYLKESLTV